MQPSERPTEQAIRAASADERVTVDDAPAAASVDTAKAARTLRERDERLQVALANSNTGTFRWNPTTGEYLDFDDNLKALFGLDGRRQVRRLDDVLDRIHPDDAPGLIAAIDRRRTGTETEFEIEFRAVLPDGDVRWLYDRARLSFDADSGLTYFVGACTDVTRQKLAERASARLAAIVEWSDDAIISKDLNGVITSWNRGAERIFGYRAEEVIGQSVTILIPEDHVDEEPRILARLRRGEAIDHYETIRRRKDGRLIDISLTVSPIFDGQGRIIGASKIARDVTDQKRLERSLHDSERRLRTLTEALPNLVWSTSADGQCDWLSGQWVVYTDVAEEDLLGLRWLDRVIHPDDRERTLARWRAACADQGDYDLEYRIRRYDGKYHWFKTRGVPVRDEQGKIVHWFGTCTDIEESKRLEAELRDADRRKNEFLATLAHELRNPLAPLRQGLALLRVPDGLGGDAETIQRMMERQIDNLVRMVDDLMEISRIECGKIELREEQLDLATVIRDAVETSRPLIDAAGHVLEVHLPDEPLTVYGDALRLSQAVTNLLNNAAKYTPENGRIWLTARREGEEAVIQVRDNGLGIPAEMLPKVFQLFTQIDRDLKRAQGGLGIGLTLVKSLVLMHGGRVEVASEGADKGAEFTLRLPLPVRAAAADTSVPANGRRLAARPRRRVLVVDDNRDCADSLGMLLRLSGDDVHVVYDGPSALKSVAEFSPDVALLDLGMPGMSGYDLAGALRLRREFERLVLIAMTGWGQEDDRSRTREAGFNAHLVKPVVFTELQALLENPPV